MPELPEVETIRRQLTAGIVGDVAKAVSLPGRRVVRRGDMESLLHWRPARVVRIDRVGKFLALCLENGSALVIHFGMSGHLRLSEGGELERHTQCVVTFASGRTLSLVDPRTFGEVFLVEAWSSRWPYSPELAGLGIDLLCDRERVVEHVRDRFGHTQRSVKAFIMDQKMMAGLGNMYADEALYRVGVHPEETCTTMGADRLDSLISSIRRVLDEAINADGSTFLDRSYRNLEGEGRYYPCLLVYQRQLRRCLLCYSVIERLRYQGRYSHFCPKCQRRL
ncbi:DNA-formamidopyrimidine glycosylase [Ferrimicrobium sp.]|uniref:DNA-formamidopyrimidine glycosylase n=1 Tax=Ferrimicrobium sp. TaxID=2926050 RepID=UPI002637F99E|nr:DNA-formamidopyrimidine glycosylase [Ferrimicrobium sp.]